MKLYFIKYIISDKDGGLLYRGSLEIKGKTKKETVDFVCSRKFLQLDKHSKMTIELIEEV